MYSDNTTLIVVIKFINFCRSIFVLPDNLTYKTIAAIAAAIFMIIIGASVERNSRKKSGCN